MSTKKIVGSYIDDYDITYIHDIILKNLTLEKETLPDLTNNLNKLKSHSQKLQTMNNKKETLNQIKKLEEDINLIKTEQKIKTYKQSSEPLIKLYLNTNGSERLKIIEKYLTLAKKYIDINVSHTVKPVHCCLNCKKILDDVNNEWVIKCRHCDNEHPLVNNLKYNEQIKNENDMENFVKALTRYQGLQNPPPKIIYTKLDQYFKERGLPLSVDIKALPYGDDGKKGNTNKEMLYNALYHIDYSSYYEDVNLIGHIYWDWKLPDLVAVKDTIMRHFIITQKAFYKIPIEVRNRVSSLGTSYRLWRHLQLVGHICNMDDFKIAENQDSINNHNRTWKMMCELANDPDIYYID